ncbi:MFS transporter [Streptomonospora sp. S1-112]|uniref:MFS transporter n=1 Tax=Streptomonospora mangrovi TaxID=2883123 RepID=A0A9X3SEH8_9ACTN|nr:MFS transporter [Streptomonospora mangrovi]MDA0563805.1 MFS transporter [Streptomonospora mangrovi]
MATTDGGGDPRPPGGPEPLSARLGVPSPRGRWPVLTAIVLDTIGVALLLPIALFYFTIVTDIPLPHLGVLMSVALVLALPTGLLGGELVDRFGAKRVMVGNNLLSALGYVGYYLAGGEAVVFGGMLLVAVSECVFWSCWLPYVKGMAGRDGFDTWFAFIEAAKAGCMVLGAGLTAVFLASSDPESVRVLVLVNIATSLVSAVLIGRHPVSGARRERAAPARRQGWGVILRDRRYVLMTAGQLLCTPISLLGGLAFPVFFAEDWELPPWIGPALFALSNLMVLLLQPWITRAVRPVSPRVLLVWSALLSLAGLAPLVVVADPAAVTGTAVAVVSTVVLTVAGILFFPTTNTALIAFTTEDNAGRVSALFHTGTSVATAATPALVGWLLGVPDALWAVMALLNLAGVACFELALRGVRAVGPR